MYTNSNVKLTCNNCEFDTKSDRSMEVHLGKCRAEHFECGLCESPFEKLSDLELHLKTCEVYECNSCYLGFHNISDVKKHIQDDHTTSTKILYSKLDRNDPSEVTSKRYSYSEL